ncbi:MAG TPA: hypothetical protein V6C84_30755 [Coleofasciculaceae cyanobacterium]|jgi:hypothetical protein
MMTKFNELLPSQPTDRSQIWIIGTRDQVIDLLNELYAKRLTEDPAKYIPILPAPFVSGKYITVIVQ